MKRKRIFFPLMFALVAGCTADTQSQPNHAMAEVPLVAPAAHSATQDEGRSAIETGIPANFSAYATTSVGDDKRCVAGVSVDEDGLNQKPVLYVSERKDQRVLWSKALQLPPDTFQGRATHCFGTGGSLYVLIQSDTQPEQTLSQTLLQVLKVDLRNGAVQARADIAPAGVADAHSAWVEEGQEHFRWQNGKVIVTGMYYRLADAEDRKPFRMELNSGLAR